MCWGLNFYRREGVLYSYFNRTGKWQADLQTLVAGLACRGLQIGLTLCDWDCQLPVSIVQLEDSFTQLLISTLQLQET